MFDFKVLTNMRSFNIVSKEKGIVIRWCIVVFKPKVYKHSCKVTLLALVG